MKAEIPTKNQRFSSGKQTQESGQDFHTNNNNNNDDNKNSEQNSGSSRNHLNFRDKSDEKINISPPPPEGLALAAREGPPIAESLNIETEPESLNIETEPESLNIETEPESLNIETEPESLNIETEPLKVQPETNQKYGFTVPQQQHRKYSNAAQAQQLRDSFTSISITSPTATTANPNTFPQMFQIHSPVETARSLPLDTTLDNMPSHGIRRRSSIHNTAFPYPQNNFLAATNEKRAKSPNKFQLHSPTPSQGIPAQFQPIIDSSSVSGGKTKWKCDVCGKVYKSTNCLSKHRWEHHAAWNETKKLGFSKHQQVQLLEAASVLVGLHSSPPPVSPSAVLFNAQSMPFEYPREESESDGEVFGMEL